MAFRGKEDAKLFLGFFWRMLLILSFVAALFLWLFTLVPPDLLCEEKVLPGPPAYDANKILQRMKYHGTNVAWHDDEGVWWFRRDGQVIRLRPIPKKQEDSR